MNLVIPERTGTVRTWPTRIVSLVSLLADRIAPTVEPHRVAMALSESPARTE